MGYLTDDYKTYVNSRCKLSEVTTLEKPFRGHTKWQSYTEEQIKAIEKWIRYVGERDDINIRAGLQKYIHKYGAHKGFDFHDDAFYGKVKGLLTHTNVRRDKFDCYPHPDLVDMIMSL
jgi:ribosomal protein S13